MKLCAHSMGTPHLDPFDAADLFAQMGYEGVEYSALKDYRCAPSVNWDRSERARLRSHCAERGLPIVSLASYVTDLNSDDELLASAEFEALRADLILAADLGASVVRLYGGRLVPRDRWERSIQLLAERVGRLVGLCRELNVRIAVENHFGTLTTTAAETMALVNAIGAPEVGVLYDQANLTHMHAEGYEEAIRLQARHVLHVHAKDLQFLDPAVETDVSQVIHVARDKRAAKWVLLGNGILPWGEILRALRRTGYDGYVSVEYTYKKVYEGDLPAPETGMKRSLEFLRGLLAGV